MKDRVAQEKEGAAEHHDRQRYRLCLYQGIRNIIPGSLISELNSAIFVLQLFGQ